MKTYKMKEMMRATGRVRALMSARRRKEIILLIGVARFFEGGNDGDTLKL